MYAERAHEIQDLEAELRGILRVLRELTPNAYPIAQEVLNEEFELSISQPTPSIRVV